MFLTACVLGYVSFPNTTSAVAGVVDDCAWDADVIGSLGLGLLSALGCDAEEFTLEPALVFAVLSVLFFLLFFAFFVDCLPLHSVADLDVPVNLELRYEIGLVTIRKTPDIILPPIRVIFME